MLTPALRTGRLLAALLTALVLVWSGQSSAFAQRATITDGRDGSLAAKYDIRRVVLDSTSRRLKVRVAVRDLRVRDVMLNLKFRDGRGAPHYVRIYRNRVNGEGYDVLVQPNAGDPWVSYVCAGLRQRWMKKKDQIVLSLPHSPKRCGGAAYDRFKVYTGPWGAGAVKDTVGRRRALTPG